VSDTKHTCGNCGHRLAMHGDTLYRHRCDLAGSSMIHPAMLACEHWAPRPAARVRVEPGDRRQAPMGRRQAPGISCQLTPAACRLAPVRARIDPGEILRAAGAREREREREHVQRSTLNAQLSTGNGGKAS